MEEIIKIISIRLLWIIYAAAVIELTSVSFNMMNQADTYSFWAGVFIICGFWSLTAALLVHRIKKIVDKYKSNNK